MNKTNILKQFHFVLVIFLACWLMASCSSDQTNNSSPVKLPDFHVLETEKPDESSSINIDDAPTTNTNEATESPATENTSLEADSLESIIESIHEDIPDASSDIREGTFAWRTGEKYTGTLIKETISGEGKLEWPGIGIYEGSFSNGKRNGTGTFIWTEKRTPQKGDPLSYEGDWKEDKIGSRGKLILYGLGTYDGEFSNQMRDGKGTFIWENGDSYTGEWKADKINGNGSLELSSGMILKGVFNNGNFTKGDISYPVKNGQASRSFNNGKASETASVIYNDGTIIIGKLNGDKFTGNVTITYKSGDTYKGTIKNGMKDGKGTYTWKNGAHYIGDWVKDKMSGQGKYYYTRDESSQYLTGKFNNGIPNGNLTYVSDKKLRYTTTWSNGTCTKVVRQK